MAETVFANIRDWVEPAHPMVIKLHNDLVALYQYIRDKYQPTIDEVFDRVSRQIGYVVTTTVPVVFEVGDKGAIKSVTMGAEHLKGTLFERELSTVLNPVADFPIPPPGIAPGTYKLYLIWREALKLKLRARGIESISTGREALGRSVDRVQMLKVDPYVQEPAHWFDPGTIIALEEAVLISVIDEVYPELQLLQRIGDIRREVANVARMTGVVRDQTAQSGTPEKEVLTELAAVLRRYGY